MSTILLLLSLLFVTSCGPGFLDMEEEPTTSNEGPWKPQDFEGVRFVSIQDACTNFFRSHNQIKRKTNNDVLKTDPIDEVCRSIFKEFLDIKKPTKKTDLLVLDGQFRSWLNKNFTV